MAENGSPREESGTLLMAALLLLALAFAGAWVFGYVSGNGPPWALLRWFGIAAAAIVVVGLLTYRRGPQEPPEAT